MADSTVTESVISQANFTATPYEDQSWEVVGEAPLGDEFVPMQFESIDDATVKMDPMFADYGGFSPCVEGKRWHLPTELVAQMNASKEEQKEQEEQLITLRPEELEALKQDLIAKSRSAAIEELSSQRVEEFAALEQRLGTFMRDLETQLQEQLGLIEQSAVSLTLEISQKIIGQAVEINPEYILEVVREAINKAGSAAIRKVRVSPEDFEFIDVIGIAKQIKEYDGTWEFEKDEAIRAGCILDTSAGEIDFRLDSAWERIKESVVKVVR